MPRKEGEIMKHTPEHNHFADGIFRGVGSYDPCKRCIMEHAAPDMYEALKDAVRTMKTYGTHNMGFAIERCGAAIKKAEGE